MAFEAEGFCRGWLVEAHFGGFVEDFGDAFGGPYGGDDFGVEAAQAGDGAPDDGRVHGKIEEAAFGEEAFLDEEGRLPDDEEQGAKHDKNNEGSKEAAHVGYAEGGTHRVIQLSAVSVEFKLFVGIGFDRLEALHGFLYDDISLGELILPCFHEFADIPAEKHGQDNDGGDGDQHDERQFFHGHEDDDHAANEDDDLADKFGQGEGDHALNLGDIAGHAAGDFAYAARFEEGDAEGDEFFVEVAAQEGHAFFADDGEELHAEIGEHALDAEEGEE